MLGIEKLDGERVSAKSTKNIQSGELNILTSDIGRKSYADVVRAGNRICSLEGGDLRKSPEVGVRHAPVGGSRPLFPGNLNRLGNKRNCEAKRVATACENIGIVQNGKKRQNTKNGISKIGKNHNSEK